MDHSNYAAQKPRYDPKMEGGGQKPVSQARQPIPNHLHQGSFVIYGGSGVQGRSWGAVGGGAHCRHFLAPVKSEL